jgi:aspartyl-tRNA(Asn)/glutamyl-tRNA(Gln) amidotransferase subunit A
MNTTSLPTDPALMSASELLALYARRSLSPVEALRAIDDRIDRFDGRINAFVTRNPDAITAARQSEARWLTGRPLGILDGVPCTVKDVMNLSGFPTRCGSNLSSPEAATDDAPAVLGLKNAGATLLGKTATTEFGWKAPGDSPQSGITRNPWDLARTPGGSSSGAAAAGAACFGPLHIGTDAGGSIRVPAAWSGLIGLKPTYGRVPQWPIGAFGYVACAGPMTRDVRDAALMLSAIARADSRDPYCLPDDARNWSTDIDKGVKGLRIGIFRPDHPEYPTDHAGASAVRDAAAALSADGALVEEVEPPLLTLRDAFDRQWGLALARLVASHSEEHRLRFDPDLLLLARAHENVSAREFLDYEIAAARFAHDMGVFHRAYDLLLCPAVPTIAPFNAVRFANSDEARWTRWGFWTFAFNISLQPAISVPLTVDASGLPRAVQLIAARYADDNVLRAARALERNYPPTFPDLEVTTTSLRKPIQ